MNRAERKRQAKSDEETLAQGIEPGSQDAAPVAAMARQMYALLLRAIRERDIDPPVKYLYAKAQASLEQLKDIKVACRKGCSHCCHIWVSATAPEILYVARLLKRRDAAILDSIRAAHGL